MWSLAFVLQYTAATSQSLTSVLRFPILLNVAIDLARHTIQEYFLTE